MPKLTRWFVKTSFLYLVAALIVGLLLAAGSTFALPFTVSGLDGAYFQLFMTGWITQLIFGVANWMFPVYTREAPRRNPTLGWLTYGFLNAGLILRVAGEPLVSSGEAQLWGWLLGTGSLLQWLAALTFVVNTWTRVKRR